MTNLEIHELQELIDFVEDGCCFEWLSDVPDYIRGNIESDIEHGIEWCAEHRDWNGAADLESVLLGHIFWSNDLGTTARVILSECGDSLYDELDAWKDELAELEAEQAELEEDE